MFPNEKESEPWASSRDFLGATFREAQGCPQNASASRPSLECRGWKRLTDERWLPPDDGEGDILT